MYQKRKALIQYRGSRSQAEMGRKYGVTQQAWSQWENSINAPSAATMHRIATDANLPIEIIFFTYDNKL